MIKLLILDIDGVMTDGTKIYGLDGLTMAKRYCDKLVVLLNSDN